MLSFTGTIHLVNFIESFLYHNIITEMLVKTISERQQLPKCVVRWNTQKNLQKFSGLQLSIVERHWPPPHCLQVSIHSKLFLEEKGIQENPFYFSMEK